MTVRRDARGVFQETVGRLIAPSLEARARLAEAEPSEALHRGAMLGLPCMTQVETGGVAADAPLAPPFTVAAWNLERCYFPEESAARLLASGADLALLSELDVGMARTSQRHTARALAERLGMRWAYGVEFLELGLGAPAELGFCAEMENRCGFHGNALLARGAIGRPFLIRLDDHGHWFDGGRGEKRVGGRCAVGARIETTVGPLLAVSVHLESAADPEHRARQMALLFDRVDLQAPALPVVIGGDLNTGLQSEGDFEAEPLFALAAERGYVRHGGDVERSTVRRSRITTPSRPFALDWFLTRGVVAGALEIRPALGSDGAALSDHELLTLEVRDLASA